jgi:hypothetical protein
MRRAKVRTRPTIIRPMWHQRALGPHNLDRPPRPSPTRLLPTAMSHRTRWVNPIRRHRRCRTRSMVFRISRRRPRRHRAATCRRKTWSDPWTPTWEVRRLHRRQPRSNQRRRHLPIPRRGSISENRREVDAAAGFPHVPAAFLQEWNTAMRAEIEQAATEIRSSLALLRRHL